MTEGPTGRQLEVLRFIAASCTERGYPPTLREICAAIGILSTNGATDHLNALERKGFISRGSMRSRSIVLTPAGRTLLGGAARNEHPYTCAYNHLAECDGQPVAAVEGGT